MEIRTVVVGQLAVNCYIVIDDATRDAVVIDPGDDPDIVAREIIQAAAEPKYILLTHGHMDHSFTAGVLQESIDAEVLMHEADVPQLDGDPEIAALFYDTSHHIPPTLGRFVSDGDTVSFGESRLVAIHTPGHTPGGLCYHSGSVVFTGDTLFAGGIGRTDLMGGSYDDLMESIREKLLTLPDDTIIYPGHGPASTVGRERMTNPWLLQAMSDEQ
ncbi:MAG: MBL fold metallo-hydrolase [Armatimonadetes bacterium]|nr:MBL fold metallo-hydrolase [Armatimonadota bacterium]